VPEPGSVLTLEVEKAAAGGRMLARHEGQIVLLWGAIPGERVNARVERVGKGVLFAETQQVLRPSQDRRSAATDWRCGGNVLAHVAYERQLQLKAEIIRDAFGRIGRIPLAAPPPVVGSTEEGYRMRARLHVQGGRFGFYRESTHELCDAAGTGQLSPAMLSWIASAQEIVVRDRLSGLAAIEIAETMAGDERACHLELRAGVEPQRFSPLGETLVGLSAQPADRRDSARVSGTPVVTEVLHIGDPTSPLTLRRDVRAFFQGNRFLLERLVGHVLSLVPGGPVVDLYAGVGLFGLALASRGAEAVTLVEGDPISGADLERNAEPFRGRARVERRSVEAFLAPAGRRGGSRAVVGAATVILDPPRTGVSKEALGATIEKRPGRIVYVSCDVATLARDARVLLDAGYELGPVTSFDLFPNTAHVETVATFSR
jgi:23S rRNA (uracil1939-C5)-methyltransferase